MDLFDRGNLLVVIAEQTVHLRAAEQSLAELVAALNEAQAERNLLRDTLRATTGPGPDTPPVSRA